MASIFDRISKRSAFPVTINGETIHVCEPTWDEIDRFAKFTGGVELGHALTLGICLVNPDGSKAFEPMDGEDDMAFAQRVRDAAGNIQPSTIKAIEDAIAKLTKPVDQGEIAKN